MCVIERARESKRGRERDAAAAAPTHLERHWSFCCCHPRCCCFVRVYMREGDARVRAGDTDPFAAAALWCLFVRMYVLVFKREIVGE